MEPREITFCVVNRNEGLGARDKTLISFGGQKFTMDRDVMFRALLGIL